MSPAQPVPEPRLIPLPEDKPYPGRLDLRVDATDVRRRILNVEQRIPVSGPGPMTLLYPKWLPGFHSPASAIELLAGLEIYAGGDRLDWRRDPVEMHAFHIEAPQGVDQLDIRFQFLTPTSSSQGDVCITRAVASIRWGALLLYPAGYFSRGIEVAASVTLPPGWSHATALEVLATQGEQTHFAPVALDVLVDSPILASRWLRTFDLDEAGEVRLALAADAAEDLEIAAEHLERMRVLIDQVDAQFGARHFDRYVFLAALSDELGGGGVEHHRCCEIVLKAKHFIAWTANTPARDVFAHEYIHSWNGKHRRGADSWTPSFERPIRNSLMWVYEGLTQYWGEVLTARAALWSQDQALDTLARTAALYDNRPGSRWRPMSDTTRDPIIAERSPLPWPSWQRSEDYYAEGQLMWLDVDTLLRELTGDERSLDDFARSFFGHHDRQVETDTYDMAELISALSAIAPHDWSGFFEARLESREAGAPLDGLRRGGYRLEYTETPNTFMAADDALSGMVNLRFSVGLTLTEGGAIQEVIWESPAFDAGLVASAQILAVNGRSFSPDVLTRAVGGANQTGVIALVAEHGGHVETYRLTYGGGLRYPHLAPIAGVRRRLDEICRPKR